MDDAQNSTHWLGAASLAKKIRRGQISAHGNLKLMLSRIEKVNPRINAIILKRVDEAIERAKAADRASRLGESWGPLHGVPISIKECFDWVGTPSTFGHLERRNHQAEANAVVVERLLQAGAIVVGKSNVPKDLADWQSFNDVYGTTLNPWDPSCSAGGSSGGSAAALASGLTALEIGSDIGGSIRIPAHFCGVYGHKPTYGVVPFHGHAMQPGMPADDLSVIGPLARTAEDLALALRLIAAPYGSSTRAWRFQFPRPKWKDLNGLRVAIITGDADFPVDNDTRRLCVVVGDALRSKGAQITLDPELPLASRTYYELYIALLRAATSVRLSHTELEVISEALKVRDSTNREYETLMFHGLTQSHRRWLDYGMLRQQLRDRWDEFFTKQDLLITPVSPTPAFRSMPNLPKSAQTLVVDGQVRPNADTYFWLGLASAAYLPATTFPSGVSSNGLPIGLQIIGPEYSDLSCIRLAERLALLGHGFRPPPEF